MFDFDFCQKQGMEALKEYAHKSLYLDGKEFETAYWSVAQGLQEKLGNDNSTIHNLWIRIECLLEQLHIPYDPHVLIMPKLYWNTFFEHMNPEPFLLETLEILKRKGFKIGVGTNMTAAIQLKKLQRLDALQYIDIMMSSEEALSEKPSTIFFERCLEKAEMVAKASVSECIFIGDSFENDIMGAAQVGMKTIWYNRKKQKRESDVFLECHYLESNFIEIISFREMMDSYCFE